jgi:hypothetical protein
MADRLSRLVNGVTVYLTAEEEAALRAEWAANAMAPGPFPTVTRRQLRIWLRRRGITSAVVEAAIDQIEDADQRDEALIEWRDSVVYDRAHPFVALIGAALGFTAEQMDAGWREAARI